MFIRRGRDGLFGSSEVFSLSLILPKVLQRFTVMRAPYVPMQFALTVVDGLVGRRYVGNGRISGVVRFEEKRLRVLVSAKEDESTKTDPRNTRKYTGK